MGRKNERVEHDVYETPPELTQAIVSMLVDRHMVGVPKTILEPSAGQGNFVKSMREAWPDSEITAIELRLECDALLYEAGANETCIAKLEQVAIEDAPPFDLVLGNPPYALATEHLTLLAEASGPNTRVAWLLRLSYLGTQERAKTVWSPDFKLQLEYLVPIIPRPSFVLGGNDMSEYALFVWRNRAGHQAECLAQKRSTAARLLAPLLWEKPRRPKQARAKRQPEGEYNVTLGAFSNITSPYAIPAAFPYQVSAVVKSMKTSVVNINLNDDCDVYIGRAGHGYDGYFGNPFKLEHESQREAVIERYQAWFLLRIQQDPQFKQRVLALRGKTLGCFCKPKPCHGDVIAAWVDSFLADAESAA